MSAPEPVTCRKSLLWPVAAGFFMQTLDAILINAALPARAASLGESPLRMPSVIVAYAPTMAMPIPASGWIADRLATLHAFQATLAGMGLVTVASALIFWHPPPQAHAVQPEPTEVSGQG